jgi:hypothetical protein
LRQAGAKSSTLDISTERSSPDIDWFHRSLHPVRLAKWKTCRRRFKEDGSPVKPVPVNAAPLIKLKKAPRQVAPQADRAALRTRLRAQLRRPA